MNHLTKRCSRRLILVSLGHLAVCPRKNQTTRIETVRCRPAQPYARLPRTITLVKARAPTLRVTSITNRARGHYGYSCHARGPVAHFFPALLLAVCRAARSHRRGVVCPGERPRTPISERYQYVPPHRDRRSCRALDTVVRHRAVTRRSRDGVPVCRSLARQRHRPDMVVDVLRHTLFHHYRVSGPLRFPAEDHDSGQAVRRCGCVSPDRGFLGVPLRDYRILLSPVVHDRRATGTTGLCRCPLPEHNGAHQHGLRRRDAAHAPGARHMHDRADYRSLVRRDTHRPPGRGLSAARELHRRQGGIGGHLQGTVFVYRTILV